MSRSSNYNDIVVLDLDFSHEVDQDDKSDKSDKSNDEADNSNNFEEPKIN